MFIQIYEYYRNYYIITIQTLGTRHFERQNTRLAKESIFYCIATVYNL